LSKLKKDLKDDAIASTHNDSSDKQEDGDESKKTKDTFSHS